MSALSEEKRAQPEGVKVYPSNTPLRSQTSDTLSIVSYNILYKDLVTEERYTHIRNDEYRSWQYRLPRIRDTISAYNADIICLQEVDVEPAAFHLDFGDYCKNKLSYDYALSPFIEFKHKKRAHDGHLGNAVLFDPHRFHLVHKEFLKKNPREMFLLFTDKTDIQNCRQCCQSSVCCIYHSFFVINVHLSGHPLKWRNRLNAIQRILNKLKQFGHKYKSPKIEKKTLKLNTNIAGQCANMRVIICGDFNGPKTGNVDKLLMHKMVDIHNYNITSNIYHAPPSSEAESRGKKTVRFAVHSKYSGAIIGERGTNIEYIREKTRAGIWISDASKGRCGIKNHKMLSIRGSMKEITRAVELVMDRVHNEQVAMQLSNTMFLKVILFVERHNIEAVDILEGVTAAFNVKLSVSWKVLPFSSEKTVELLGRVDAMKSAVSMVVRRLFENKRCRDTEKLFDPQVELDAHYKHPFEFGDVYDIALRDTCGADEDVDAYYDRMKHFPTYGDGRAFGSMDFIYFTKYNMKLKAVTHPLEDKALRQRIHGEVESMKKTRGRRADDEAKNKREQSVLSSVLQIPNDRIVSDHLPIAATFVLPNMCGSGGRNRQYGESGVRVVKCACFEGKHRGGGRLRGKINKNKKKYHKSSTHAPITKHTYDEMYQRWSNKSNNNNTISASDHNEHQKIIKNEKNTETKNVFDRNTSGKTEKTVSREGPPSGPWLWHKMHSF